MSIYGQTKGTPLEQLSEMMAKAEANGTMMYYALARLAKEQGLTDVSKTFIEAANQEAVHAGFYATLNAKVPQDFWMLVRGVMAAEYAGEKTVKDFADIAIVSAANRDAVDALLELGAARVCPSAETPAETVDALLRARPLFLSVTAPVGGGTGPVRRFAGRPPLLSYVLDGRWTTIADTAPWRSGGAPGELDAPVREDYAWDAPAPA